MIKHNQIFVYYWPIYMEIKISIVKSHTMFDFNNQPFCDFKYPILMKLNFETP